MPPTEEPVAIPGSEGYAPPTDVTYEARMQWPYLAGWHAGGGVPQNGREVGCWIAGHMYGRNLHGEPGLRVEIPESRIAGAVATLLEYGLIVQQHSRPDAFPGAASLEALVCIDVWVQ